MWLDEGAWLAWGVSAVFILAGVVMHRAFIRILKSGTHESAREKQHE